MSAIIHKRLSFNTCLLSISFTAADKIVTRRLSLIDASLTRWIDRGCTKAIKRGKYEIKAASH